MKIGEYQNLVIDKFVSFGAYLKDESNNKVLLPKKKVPRASKVGDSVKVYVYNDSKGRLIATTDKVYISAGEIAKLKVKDINDKGAFLDIGIERDLLLPYSEQKKDINIGDRVLVYMYVDKSNRLAATMYFKNKKSVTKVKNSTIRTLEYEKNANDVYKIIKHKFKGHLIYTDKTAKPKQIEEDFGVSKISFKKSIGKLLKDKKLKITEKGIFLY